MIHEMVSWKKVVVRSDDKPNNPRSTQEKSERPLKPCGEESVVRLGLGFPDHRGLLCSKPTETGGALLTSRSLYGLKNITTNIRTLITLNIFPLCLSLSTHFNIKPDMCAF